MTKIVVSAIDSAGQIAAATLQANVTPPVGDYPAGVIKNGLQAIWDHQGIKPPTAIVKSLPSGVTRSGSTITFNASVDMTGFDLRGASLVINKTIEVILRQCLMRGAGGIQTLLDLGTYQNTSIKPNVTLEDCEADLAGCPTTFEAGIRHWGGNLTIRRSILKNAPKAYLSKISPDQFLCEDCYVQQFGINSVAADHLEHFHLYAGASIIRRSFFELVRKAGGGMTGHIYPESYSGPVTATIEENIMTGTKIAGGYYPIQVSRGSAGTCTAIINRNVAEPGINGGFIAKNGAVAVSGVGNVDLTGKALTV